MISIDIPGRGRIEIDNLVLDVNGTVAVDGRVSDAVEMRLRRLAQQVKVLLVTADTHGTAAALSEKLSAEVLVLQPGGREAQQKGDFIRALGADRCVAMGNGANDVTMLETAALGIAVLGREGMVAELARTADVLVTEPTDALDLLLLPKRLVATLRR